ncbi:transcriptional regulator sterile apetala [Fagus crenata]
MSSSSPSSPNSSQDGNDNGNGNGIGGGSSSARRGGDFGPSTSRPRVNEVGPSTSRPRVNEVWPWPEHFVETLAARVAFDASNSIGRLAAYPALLNVFLLTGPLAPPFTIPIAALVVVYTLQAGMR